MARRYVYDPATNVYKAVGVYRYADNQRHDGYGPKNLRKPTGDPSELPIPVSNDDLSVSYGARKRKNVNKATPSYEYEKRRNEQDMRNSFGKSVKRYDYNPAMNAYIEKSVKMETATAAANPWDLTINEDGTTDSDSVGHDPEGNNHEPSRAKQKKAFFKKEKSFKKTSRRALFQPGEERLEKPGDDHDTGGFAPGQLVKDWEDREDETPEDRKKRKRKIREQIDPEAKRHFDDMTNDDIIEHTNDGGNAMAQKFTRGTQEPVTVTKGATNQALIADMMAKQYGYSARQSVDAMSNLVKSEANMHAIEAGNLFELHEKGDTYVIAPIGYGPTGDLARTLSFEYVDVFENNLEKAKMRASMQQKAELRKSVIEFDSEYFHRNAIDAVLSKGYRFAKDLSQEDREEGEGAKRSIRGMLGNFEAQREREGSDAKTSIKRKLHENRGYEAKRPNDLQESFGKTSEADAVDGGSRRGRVLPPSRFSEDNMLDQRIKRARSQMAAGDRATRDKDRATKVDRENFNSYSDLGGGPDPDPSQRPLRRSLLDIFSGRGRRKSR